MGADVALALAAGLVAAVNPCGFALLPAYLSFLINDESVGRRGAALRALALTGAMTAGFVLVFGVFGLLVAPLAGTAGKQLPWATIVIGVVLIGLGGWLLAGRQLPSFVPKLGRAGAVRRSAVSMTLFGMAYAVASLGCTIGPFLAVVVTSFRAGRPLLGVGLFLVYAMGMGLVVGSVALAVALARMSLVRWLRRAAPVISRLGGLLMLLAGAYVAYYGWYSLRVFAGRVTRDPIVDGVATVQQRVSDWLDAAGAVSLAVVFGILLIGVVATAAVRRRVRR
jgi:cytochrome c biogenesis protein CcdA